jgi:hypothetical protein
LCKVHVWTGSGTPNLQGVKMFLASDRRGCFDISENLYSSMYEILKVHLTVSARMVSVKSVVHWPLVLHNISCLRWTGSMPPPFWSWQVSQVFISFVSPGSIPLTHMSNVCNVWDKCSELLECNFFSIWIVILDSLGVGRRANGSCMNVFLKEVAILMQGELDRNKSSLSMPPLPP